MEIRDPPRCADMADPDLGLDGGRPMDDPDRSAREFAASTTGPAGTLLLPIATRRGRSAIAPTSIPVRSPPTISVRAGGIEPRS